MANHQDEANEPTTERVGIRLHDGPLRKPKAGGGNHPQACGGKKKTKIKRRGLGGDDRGFPFDESHCAVPPGERGGGIAFHFSEESDVLKRTQHSLAVDFPVFRGERVNGRRNDPDL